VGTGYTLKWIPAPIKEWKREEITEERKREREWWRVRMPMSPYIPNSYLLAFLLTPYHPITLSPYLHPPTYPAVSLLIFSDLLIFSLAFYPSTPSHFLALTMFFVIYSQQFSNKGSSIPLRKEEWRKSKERSKRRENTERVKKKKE